MTPYRSGFASFVGRPNAGKSTLMNAIIGHKVAICSDKPQTTRRAIRGIVTRPDAQLVIVDTPGMHRPRTLLGEHLGTVARRAFAHVDVVGFCVPATEKVGPGDRHILGEIATLAPGVPVLGIVTKTDLADRQQIAAALSRLSDSGDFADIVPVSALAGDQIDIVTDLLIARLPAGPKLYPDEMDTDERMDVRIAEIIRESALAGAREELPHSIAVMTDEIIRKETRTDVYATIYVERSSQKAIVVGRKGSGIARIGTQARPQIAALLGTPVYLSVHVTVASNWQSDTKLLRRLGFTEEHG